jgi:hypothetical protein
VPLGLGDAGRIVSAHTVEEELGMAVLSNDADRTSLHAGASRAAAPFVTRRR